MVFNILLIWQDIKKKIFPSAISLWSLLALNPDVPPQIISIVLKEWSFKGFMDLVDSDFVKSFEHVRAKFNISCKDMYKYL